MEPKAILTQTLHTTGAREPPRGMFWQLMLRLQQDPLQFALKSPRWCFCWKSTCSIQQVFPKTPKMLLYLSILSRFQVAESIQSWWTLTSVATIQPTLPTYWLGQKYKCRKPSLGLITGPIIHNQIRAWVIIASNSVGACPCPHLSQVQPAAFMVAVQSMSRVEVMCLISIFVF